MQHWFARRSSTPDVYKTRDAYHRSLKARAAQTCGALPGGLEQYTYVPEKCRAKRTVKPAARRSASARKSPAAANATTAAAAKLNAESRKLLRSLVQKTRQDALDSELRDLEKRRLALLVPSEVDHGIRKLIEKIVEMSGNLPGFISFVSNIFTDEKFIKRHPDPDKRYAEAVKLYKGPPSFQAHLQVKLAILNIAVKHAAV
jgi:hypothetical protein